MGKPTICIGENKDRDNREADQRLCFRYSVQFLFYLNPKFQASSSFLCLYRPVCVVPVRKPHCWFSHEAAQIKVVYKGVCITRTCYPDALKTVVHTGYPETSNMIENIQGR